MTKILVTGATGRLGGQVVEFLLRRVTGVTNNHAIIDAAKRARRVLVIGASFIGLEVAAALRAREIEVRLFSQPPFRAEPICP